MKRSARMAAFLLAAALSAAPCLAEFTPVEVPQATSAPAAPEAMENVPQITEKGLTLGNNSVKYPEITGMADENIQQQVNDAILQAGKIENRLSRMAVLMSSPVPLTVTYSAALADDVLSVAILSSGALETERATQEWAAVNIDLRTGQEITFDDLFTDADEARAKMEETIADEILPDMSAHLAAAELLPLPDVFSLTEYGLTLHYPIRRFETLSERAGTITFLWSELADVLDLSEDSVLTRLGVGKHLMLAADVKETLTAALSGGAFPGIPAALGDSVQGLIDTYQLLNDPDLAGDQRMISLEDGAFRNVYILTDNLTRKLDSSVAQSIRADRLMLLGLVSIAGAESTASTLPIKVELDFSKYQFTAPEEITVTIRATDVTDEKFTSPVSVLGPNGSIIEAFGTPLLDAGASQSCTIAWNVTQADLNAGQLAFRVRYPRKDENGIVSNASNNFVKRISQVQAEPEIQVSRTITPGIARKGQEVSVRNPQRRYSGCDGRAHQGVLRCFIKHGEHRRDSGGREEVAYLYRDDGYEEHHVQRDCHLLRGRQKLHRKGGGCDHQVRHGQPERNADRGSQGRQCRR
mgnify:CR=1 FL=1